VFLAFFRQDNEERQDRTVKRKEEDWERTLECCAIAPYGRAVQTNMPSETGGVNQR